MQLHVCLHRRCEILYAFLFTGTKFYPKGNFLLWSIFFRFLVSFRNNPQRIEIAGNRLFSLGKYLRIVKIFVVFIKISE